MRQQEFDERGGITRNELLKTIRLTVEEAASIVSTLDPNVLSEKRVIQHKEVSVFYAVYHVVEHFSMHTGQIIQIAKERTGKDLEFYIFEKGVPKERWRGKPE